MAVPIREDDIFAEFDRRCEEGLIFYDDKPEIHLPSFDGFQFEFAVTAAISKKPYIKDNKDEPKAATATAKRPPGYAPGSDIDISGYEIGDVSQTHLLAFNKFCMYRPHLLLLTKDGYKRQYDQLDLDDIQSAWNVLEALNWNYFVFFNCGKEGGCSRLHKHLQLTPYLPDRLAPWPAMSRRPAHIPYQYILRGFDDDLGPKQLFDVYTQMVDEARRILDPGAATSSYVPHNFMLGRNWMLVIPRRKAGVGGAYSNTLGLLGMVSVASNDELRCWLDQGPLGVIQQLGVLRHSNGAAQGINGDHL
ncbi:ap4a phosphorylase 2 [Seiridium cupressi]